MLLALGRFSKNTEETFYDLREDKNFSDVTLVCENNQQISCHKIVLSASSPLLAAMLRSSGQSHHLLYFLGIKGRDLSQLVDFIYKGQLQMYKSDLADFLSLAERLKVKGVSGGDQRKDNRVELGRGEEEEVNNIFETNQTIYSPEESLNDLKSIAKENKRWSLCEQIEDTQDEVKTNMLNPSTNLNGFSINSHVPVSTAPTSKKTYHKVPLDFLKMGWHHQGLSQSHPLLPSPLFPNTNSSGITAPFASPPLPHCPPAPAPPTGNLSHTIGPTTSLKETKEPMLTGIHRILSTKDALFHIKNPLSFTSNVEDMDKAASGTVWLFRAPLGAAKISDWRAVGHHFRLTGGAAKMTTGEYQHVDRKVAHIVCPDGSTSKGFRRITWTYKDSPRDTLVQFWGNEQLSVRQMESDSRSQQSA